MVFNENTGTGIFQEKFLDCYLMQWHHWVHWNGHFVILKKLSSLTAPKVVKKKTIFGASDEIYSSKWRYKYVTN